MSHLLFSGGFTEPVGYSPKIWYKANSEAYGDGAAVTQVNDRSGNGKHLATVGGAGLTFETNEFNGQPVYRGVGTGDISTANIGSGALIAAANGTAFVVCRPAVNNNGYIWLLSESGVAEKASHLANVAATVTARNNDGALDSTGTAGHVTTTKYILTWLHTGGNVSLGSNDTRTASLTSAASGNTTIAAGDDMFLFGSGGANYYNGDIAEFVGFDTALTETQRKEWEQWFAFKYGITLPY